MAVLSFQLVFTMVMASILSKVSPKFSFGRWILTSRLVRYLHPSDDELRTVGGVPTGPGKGRGKRGDYRKFKDEPFTVPKSINLTLDSAPIKPMDLLPVQYYTEYQWLIDFALYGLGIYFITEVYYTLMQPDEINLSMLWCLLQIGFALSVMCSLTAMYFKTEEGGERILCVVFALFFLVLAMMVLIVDESKLEFGIAPGHREFSRSAHDFLNKQGMSSEGPASLMTFRIMMAIFCAILGSFLTFPGLRLAKMHTDALKYATDRPFLKLLLYLNMIFPLFIILLWVKPVARDILVKDGYDDRQFQISANVFESLRILLIFGFCLFRFTLIWPHLQAHLNMAVVKVEELKKEAGRISAKDLQKLVVRVYYYICVVALQYATPLILLLFSTCLLKTLGDYKIFLSFGVELPSIKNATGSTIEQQWSAAFAASQKEGIAGTAAQFTLALVHLKQVFTPMWFRGILSFLVWWISTSWFITSAFGMLYYTYFSI